MQVILNNLTIIRSFVVTGIYHVIVDDDNLIAWRSDYSKVVQDDKVVDARACWQWQ